MSSNNPDVTVSDIANEVERILRNPGLSTTTYLPWASYAYQKTFQALSGVGMHVREALFGDNATISLTTSTLQKSLTTDIPRFGGVIKVEVKYGASGDDWNPASKLKSIAHWSNTNNVSTTYRSKTQPLYTIIGNSNLIVIPVAPESGAQAKIYYVKRPYQLTDGNDVIDIPYRFIYPIFNYVQAKAVERVNEDYSASKQIENNFEKELIRVAEAADSEFNEEDGTDGVETSASSPIFSNPFRR